MVGPDDCVEAIINSSAAEDENVQSLFGIIPRAALQLQEYVESAKNQMDVTIKCKYIEIYNDKTWDLIADGGSKLLEVRENSHKSF